MKKLTFIIILCLLLLSIFTSCDFFSVLSTSSNEIEIISPTKNETLVLNSDYTITWSTKELNLSPKVNIYTFNGNYTLIEESIENTGSYNWTVNNINITKIKVSDASYPDTVYGISDSFIIEKDSKFNYIDVEGVPTEISENKTFSITVTAYDNYDEVFEEFNSILYIIPIKTNSDEEETATSVTPNNISHFQNGTVIIDMKFSNAIDSVRLKILHNYINDEFETLEYAYISNPITVVEAPNVSVSPSNNEAYVLCDTPIKIYFDKMMDFTSVKDAFSLNPPIDDNYFSYEWSSEIITDSETGEFVEMIFTYTVIDNDENDNRLPYYENAYYTITIGTGAHVADNDSISLTQNYTSHFYTAVIPEVLTISPLNSDSLVNIDSPITITFDTEMDTDSVESNFKLFNSSSDPISGSYTWSNNNKTMTFTPNYLTSYNTHTYYLYTGAKTKDLDPDNNNEIYSNILNTIEESFKTEVYYETVLNTLSTVNGNYGNCSAMSNNGDIFVIGSTGAVYIFKKNGTSWDVTEITNSASKFGLCLDIDGNGDTLIVGAKYSEKAFIYEYNGVWELSATLSASDGSSNDVFGKDVAISDDGNRVIVSATDWDNANSNNGCVYVFDKGTGWTGTLSTNATIIPPATNGNARFGNNIDISDDGETIVITSNFSNDSPPIYVYRENGTNWEILGIPEALLTEDEYIGFYNSKPSLSSDGNRLIIGDSSYSPDYLTNSAGIVLIFDWNSSEWIQTKAIPQELNSDDSNGESVALSEDGSRFISGAPGDAIYGQHSGSAYSYMYDGSDWSYELFNFDELSQNDSFGESVAISADGLIQLVCPSDKLINGKKAVYLYYY